MVIIIDGYNLLKQLHPNNKENLEWHKKNLLRELGAYKKMKEGSISEILVVFDGGGLAHATREIHHGIVMLETGYKRSADDWIIDYVDRYKNQEITIVSMDRQLCLTCEQHGAFSISVFDFAHAVKVLINNADAPSPTTPSTITHRFNSSNVETDVALPDAPPNLDELMQAGAKMRIPSKIDAADSSSSSKSPITLSKQDKTLLKKIKKIY